MDLCLIFHVKAYDGEYIYETDKDIDMCNVQILMEGRSENLWYNNQDI